MTTKTEIKNQLQGNQRKRYARNLAEPLMAILQIPPGTAPCQYIGHGDGELKCRSAGYLG